MSAPIDPDRWAVHLAEQDSKLPGNATIFGGAFPPASFQVSATSRCVTLRSRGGVPQYDGGTSRFSIEAKAWAENMQEAWEIWKLLHPALHQKSSGYVVWSEVEVEAQHLTDDADRHYILGFFSMHMRLPS